MTLILKLLIDRQMLTTSSFLRSHTFSFLRLSLHLLFTDYFLVSTEYSPFQYALHYAPIHMNSCHLYSNTEASDLWPHHKEKPASTALCVTNTILFGSSTSSWRITGCTNNYNLFFRSNVGSLLSRVGFSMWNISIFRFLPTCTGKYNRRQAAAVGSLV